MLLQALSKSIIIYMISTKWLLLYFEEGQDRLERKVSIYWFLVHLLYYWNIL